MQTIHTHKKLTWIDLENPTREEVLALMEQYDIHPLVAEELLQPTVRPKVDLYDKSIYLILHFPVIKRHSNQRKTQQEVDFVIGKDFLITVHYDVVDSLYEFSKAFEVNSILDKSNIGNHAGFLFFHMIRGLYGDLAIELDRTNDILKKIEKNIFEGQENDMVKAISETKRKLLGFKQAVRFHKEVLKSFEVAGKEFFGQPFTYYLRAIVGEHAKVSNILEGHKEILHDLHETNNSLLNSKTNEVMKNLTIMTFIMLPLTLITGVFGMNTLSNLVFIRNGRDFFIIIGGMTLTALIMFVYFKIKKWF